MDLGRAAAVLAVVAAAGPALLVSGLLPAARFTRERIEITVRPGAIDVDGLYVYEGRLPVPWTQGLSVPYVQGGGQEAPVVVEAELVDDDGGPPSPLAVRWILGTPRLSVPVRPGVPSRVRVRFTQRAIAGSATYLLTTTAPWGSPLERGEYVLVPRGVELTSSSLGAGAPLQVVRERFAPDRDWSFTWREGGTPCGGG